MVAFMFKWCPQYRYDFVGNRSGMTAPDGGRFTYSYNSLQRLSRVVNPEGCGPRSATNCEPEPQYL
jgi:hypothetical protein